VRALTIVALVAAFALVDVCLQPPIVRGQSLAEIAAREKERRKGKTDKVITEADLKKAGRADAPPAATEEATATGDSQPQAPAAASGQKGEKTDEEKRADRVKDWGERRQKAQEDVARLTARIAELQAATGDQRLLQTGPNRVRAMGQLEEARQELQELQQRMEDMEEERRREGFSAVGESESPANPAANPTE
jgi:hypothetical protein